MLEAAEVVSRLEEYAARLAERSGSLPAGVPQVSPQAVDGSEVAVEDGHYVWVSRERGARVSSWASADLDTFLFRVVSWLAAQQAMRWARAHPDPYLDERRSVHARRVEWMTVLSPAWGERERAGIAAELERRPYQDPQPAIPADVPLPEAVDRCCARLAEWYAVPIARDDLLLAGLEREWASHDEVLFRYCSAVVRAVFDDKLEAGTYDESAWPSFLRNAMKALDPRWHRRVVLDLSPDPAG